MKRWVKNVLGFCILFISVTVVASVAILLYNFVIKETDKNIALTAILIFLVIIFLTLVYFLIDLFRRKFTVDNPVEQILAATEKITKGDFSVRLFPARKKESYDEFDQIMIGINRLTEELSKTESLNNDFIANVSHEIKTPLAIIQNYAYSLKDANLTQEKKEEYVDVLIKTTDKLTLLVQNILRLNKLENQTVLPNIQKIDLTETIRACVLDYVEKIEKKNIELSLDIDEIFGYTDQSMLTIIVNNLLSNAVKFTKNNIYIGLKNKGDFLVLQVSDNGAGINEQVGERIFDKFYQGETSHAIEGNGLGLALVKKVIDILGGEISVDSEQDVKTTFTVKLNIKNEE